MSEPEQVTAAKGAQAAAAEESMLMQIARKMRLGGQKEALDHGQDIIREFIHQVVDNKIKVSADADSTINALIAQIDQSISSQVNEILHNKDFQKLEASWRGIRYLVDNSETSSMLKIRVFNASKKELLKDLQRGEIDQTVMFKKIYAEEFGTFGGEPLGAMIGDFEIGRHPEDIEFIERMSQVAAAAHAPFLTAAAPDLLNLDSFTEINEARDIGKIFDNNLYSKWRSFRESEDSKYVGLALPHILMRLPYGKDTKPVEEFSYEEKVDGSDHSKYLWGNAAYALGTRLTNAFAKYGWCAAIRGVEGGGLVEGLPLHAFQMDEGDIALKCPTEVAIPETRDKELSDYGFIPLVHCKGRDYAAFFGVQSANKPKKYNKPEANANARLSSQLPYILAVSRFAHYLKVIMRDKIGSFMSREDTEKFLNEWIMQYVTEDDTASQSVKAQFPLRNAKVEVVEVPGKPGVYRAIAFLRPHFQLDELTVSLRLVADLPTK